ncbi:MAG: tetratricopeptide repeat protein [Vicinamibacterales bacterium]
MTARRLLLVFALLLAASTSSSSQPGQNAAPAVDPLVARAQAEIQRGRYQEAEAILTPAVATNLDAALELGLLQRYLGRPAATATLQRLMQQSPQRSAADFLRMGRAARALRQSRDANDYFRQADRLQPNDPTINTEWGELFLDNSEFGEALKSFQPAIKADPQNVRARFGMARVAVQENPPAAREMLDALLEADSRFVPAHLLKAEIDLGNRRRAEARESIDEALDINPNSLEALALAAAVAMVEGRTDDYNARVAEALRLNPSYGEIYRTAGDQLALNYRFDEAVELTRRALMIEPNNSRAYGDLGMQLLRTGDEAGARQALETAFRLDASYTSLVTRNLLEMLDELDKFETIRDGDIVMRFHPEEAAVMREYALPLAKRAIETLSKQWDFTPTGPILIEMFPRHDDFAVRTLGLPGMIGALGACFGRVVTLDSPRARPPGQFSWQATLWHEIAHVITLQMSGNRVPRWLTEGISEWEERRASPDWGREMVVSFAQAMNADKVLKLRDLNDGFTDPELISLAYFESSLLVEHLAATYGEPALRTLLRAYGNGLEGDDALREAFNATADDIQASFDAKLERDFGQIRRALNAPDLPDDAGVQVLRAAVQANPDSFPLRLRLGNALREAGDTAAAIAELERAAELVPAAVGQANPHAMIAAIALEQQNEARAIEAIEAQLKTDVNDVETARRLASMVVSLNEPARTTAAYERVVALDPFDSSAQSMVGRLAMQRKDVTRAVRAFRAALATSPSDRAASHLDLAEALVLAGDRTEARRQVLAALEIAPSFERAQDLLLQLVDGGV